MHNSSRQPGRLQFGASPAIAKVLAECVLYASVRHPFLILGERGTGKSALAQYVHELSGRPGEFKKVSVSNVPEHLEYSYLAGHSRGAFTGAYEDRIGVIEAAHKGTLFLDELGLASPRIQEILLQLLEDGVVRRVGEVRDRMVDVRFIGATNADLEELIDAGRFRSDLRDRFGYHWVRLPSLAERRDEILPLADQFLQREADRIRSAVRPALSAEARAALLAAPWRGNIRELEGVCAYAVLHMDGEQEIGLDTLPPDFTASLGDTFRHRCDESRESRLRTVLAQTNGNKSKAARILGISRTQLYRLLG